MIKSQSLIKQQVVLIEFIANFDHSFEMNESNLKINNRITSSEQKRKKVNFYCRSMSSKI